MHASEGVHEAQRAARQRRHSRATKEAVQPLRAGGSGTCKPSGPKKGTTTCALPPTGSLHSSHTPSLRVGCTICALLGSSWPSVASPPCGSSAKPIAGYASSGLDCMPSRRRMSVEAPRVSTQMYTLASFRVVLSSVKLSLSLPANSGAPGVPAARAHGPLAALVLQSSVELTYT